MTQFTEVIRQETITPGRDVETALHAIGEGKEISGSQRDALTRHLGQLYQETAQTTEEKREQVALLRSDLRKYCPDTDLRNVPSLAENTELIPDGKEAFARLKEMIAGAKESIVINMFLWRDDAVGNEMAQAILDAVEKNPKLRVEIYKDRLATMFEFGEQGKRSFWHWDATDAEMLTAKTVVANLYNTPEEAARHPVREQNPLAAALLKHPQVSVEREGVRNDHSKFVIVDGVSVWTGGRNFGEEYRDRWRDLTAVFHSKVIVQHFLDRLKKGPTSQKTDSVSLSMNVYDTEQKAMTRQEIRPTFREFMEDSLPGSEVWIEMAYFGETATTSQIIAAAKRGVKIRIITAQRSNLQDDLNKQTLKQMLMDGGGNVTVYLHPKMVHTKAWLGQSRDPASGQFVWDRLIFGSANLNAQAIYKLGEVNLVIRDAECPLMKEVHDVFEQGMNDPETVTVTDPSAIRYNWLKAAGERTVAGG